AAAIVGSSAFAFGGFLTSQVGHLNQLSATAWMPAIALAADTALRRHSLRAGVLGALALAAQLLAGHAQESYMTLWVVAALLGWRTLTSVVTAVSARQRDAASAGAAGLDTELPRMDRLV